MLKSTKDLIVDFNLSEGFKLHTSKKNQSAWIAKKLETLNVIGPSIYRSFQEIEKMVQDPSRNVGVLLNYCETLLPINLWNRCQNRLGVVW